MQEHLQQSARGEIAQRPSAPFELFLNFKS
jgi:hypothetical protein